MPTKIQKTDGYRTGAADGEVRASSGNVFADLGLADAGERLAKAELAHVICTMIRAAKLTQVQAAKRLGIDQPKVSALMRGRLKDFSIDRLLRFANRLGRDVLIHLRPPKQQSQASIRVRAEV
jgi:predicted XRE-type DNA-binding protein